MKHAKRLFVLNLALVMVLAMTPPGVAADLSTWTSVTELKNVQLTDGELATGNQSQNGHMEFSFAPDRTGLYKLSSNATEAMRLSITDSAGAELEVNEESLYYMETGKTYYLIYTEVGETDSLEVKLAYDRALKSDDLFSHDTLQGDEKAVRVTGLRYKNYGGELVIPETLEIDGAAYTVREIAGGAFRRHSALTGVTIPEGVTTIEDDTFSGCTGLTSVTIPGSVTSIGNRAFSGCTGLTSVTIPEGVTSIGWGAFSGCTGLTSVTIPEGVTSIGWDAFRGCTGLTGVTIPGSVTTFGESAFYECISLTSVTILEGVTTIGDGAFWGCTGLTSVTIPESVTTIGDDAFYNTPWLANLGDFAIIRGVLVEYHGDGGDVTIPEGVTSIGNSAFYECISLTSVTIPEGVTSIGRSAFSGCTGLIGVTILEGVTTIGSYAFLGCADLTDVTIPEGVTSIGSSAFWGCTDLTGVTIPDSVATIGDYAFYGCTGLKTAGPIGGDYNIEFGWMEVIPEGAFQYYTGLTGVTIPEGVTSIGDWAFRGCTGLTGVTIPESVTSIGDDAFYSCNDLTVYGPIGSYVEQYCDQANIPFVGYIGSGTASSGALTGENEKEVAWTITEKGQVAVSVGEDEAPLDEGEAVWVACYDMNGKFTGVEWISADTPTAKVDPTTPSVKLFWVNGQSQPLSSGATVWGK